MFECGVISTEYFGNSLGFGTRCEWDIYKSAPRQPVRMKFFFFGRCVCQHPQIMRGIALRGKLVKQLTRQIYLEK